MDNYITDTIRINIDGFELSAAPGQTILSAARANGIEIPTLCHDERVAPYGACGLCVVEAAGFPRLLRACSTAAEDGMVIRTNTPRVRETRKTALELLLSDHEGDCRPPCALACPAQTDCQGYAALIANGQPGEALALIMEKIPLPGSIGRICTRPCEAACRRALVEEPVSIAGLKRFAADAALAGFAPKPAPETGKRVAIIGGGPGGLSAAWFLRLRGHAVTVYDAMPEMGGMLRYGIPEYRLPRAALDADIAAVSALGVKLVNGAKVGRDVSFAHLRETHDATLVAIGAWASSGLGCPGQEHAGVFAGTDFLRAVALNEPLLTGGRVAVVGGGNTAMDACRTAVRLGAEQVYVIYRRTKAEMPADPAEVREAMDEGVIFKFLAAPIEVIAEDGRVSKIRLQQMRLGEPDSSGRHAPEPIAGAEETLALDAVISAIGQKTDPAGFDGLALTKRGTIAADEYDCRTNLPGVFAVGDATNWGASVAVEAIGEARRAAEAIHAWLRGEEPARATPYFSTREVSAEDFVYKTRISREKPPHLKAGERKRVFTEVSRGFSEEQARAEAARCLECGCEAYFRCGLVRYAGEYGVSPEKYAGGTHSRETDESNPFIKYDPNKCILCGLCVRVCDEAMGVAALGLSERGFDAAVRPALNMPLAETECSSCGQCAALCPTGALAETLPIAKSAPLAEDITRSTCAFCGAGCQTALATRGGLLLRALPGGEKGLLCAKGRFGHSQLYRAPRLTRPLARKDGRLAEIPLSEALTQTAKRMQGVSARYGPGALAVAISDKFTNEEIFLMRKYAKEALQTDNVYCLNGTRSGLADVLGADAGANTLAELSGADVIVLFCEDVAQSHAMAGLAVKRAVERGAKLILISSRESQADEWVARSSGLKLAPGKDLSLLREIAKALIYAGREPENAHGFAELKAFLERVTVSAPALAAAEMYAGAKNAMFLFDQKALTADAARLIADIAVIAGQVGRPRAGIVALRQNCNSQGLADMGVNPDGLALAQAVERENVRGLVIFGEDAPSLNLKKLEFLAVCDYLLTETAEMADVVLPCAAPFETDGTYTSGCRELNLVRAALPPAAGLANWQLVQALAGESAYTMRYENVERVRGDMCAETPGYGGADLLLANGGGVALPVGAGPVLYRDGFATPDGLARLTPPEGDRLFTRAANTHAAYHRFESYMADNRLAR